jgi:hypothetical protein
VTRHKAHITEAIVEAKATAVVERAESTLDQLRKAVTIATEMVDDARKAGADGWGATSRFLDTLTKQLALQAKLLGEVREGTTVNVLVASAEWTELRARLVVALQPYPEAMAAVKAALQ